MAKFESMSPKQRKFVHDMEDSLVEQFNADSVKYMEEMSEEQFDYFVQRAMFFTVIREGKKFLISITLIS